MNFTEAVKLIAANPAGPGAVAVSRPDDIQYVFAAPPLPDGRQSLMGGWTRHGRKSESHAVVLCAEDVLADDWEVVVFE